MISCLLSFFIANGGRWLWFAGLVFTIAHAYPFRIGLKFMGIKEEERRAMQDVEVKKMLGVFVKVNAKRLKFVDVVS